MSPTRPAAALSIAEKLGVTQDSSYVSYAKKEKDGKTSKVVVLGGIEITSRATSASLARKIAECF